MEGDLEAMAREHAPFLRRLAIALVGDHDGAEDLVQETWLAAAAQPRGEVRSPRAWLAGTARRIAASRWRARGRRPESRLAEEPATEAADPARISATLEAERALAAALEALSEAQRTALWLRYREGLGIAEIAERVGAPANTVRDRLRRGLGSLRQRLDRGEGGMAFALAPLVPREAIGRATMSTGSKATLASSARLAQAFLVVFLLSAVGALLAIARDDGASGVRLEARSDGPGERNLAGVPGNGLKVARAESGEGRTVVGSGRKAVEGARPDAGASAPIVRVQVVTEAGTSAAHARVWLQGGTYGRLFVPDKAEVADASGVAVLKDNGDRNVTYFAAFDDPTGRTLFGQAVLNTQGDDARRFEGVEPVREGESEVVIEVSTRPLLGGRVVDTDGRPVSGASVKARVELNGQANALTGTTTDADGDFIMTSIPLPLSIPPEDALCRIEIRLDSRVIAPVATRDDVLLNTVDTEIVVPRGRQTTGAIVGELRIAEGAPGCPGCRVALLSLSDPHWRRRYVTVPRGRNGETDPGVLHVSSVPPGTYAIVVVGGADRLKGALAGIEVRPGETTDAGIMYAGVGGHVRLVPTHVNAGAVASTRPAGGEFVSLKSEATEVELLQADKNGEWSRKNAIASGRWFLDQAYTGGGLAIDAPPIEIVEGQTIEREVRLRPCAEYAIALDGLEDRSWSSLTLSARETGAGGHWRIERAPVSRPSLERDGLRVRLPRESTCEIRVTTDTGLQGSARVEVGATGAPADPVRIELDGADDD